MPLPVYLINLPKDVDRKQCMLIELQKAGLLGGLVHVNAVYGKELSRSEVESIYDERVNLTKYHKVLSLGEIGCYASHLECWKLIAAAPAPVALVLEDDLRLNDHFLEAIDEVLQSGLDFDMVKLIGRRNKESVLRRWSIGRNSVIRYFRVPSHTTAYLISRRGAGKLLASRPRFFRPVDVDLRFWWESGPDFRLYGLQPYPARHADLPSVLGSRPPSPHGAFKYRWLKFTSQLGYTVNLVRHALLALRKPLNES